MKRPSLAVLLVALAVALAPRTLSPEVFSAALRARLEAARQPAAFSEGGSQDALEERELTVFVEREKSRDVYEEVRELASLAGKEAYGFSEAGGFFFLTGATEGLLGELQSMERISFVEESDEPSNDLEIVPFNLDAQDTHEVQALRERHLVAGKGVIAGVWDGGSVLSNHVEFQGRVLVRDAVAPVEHATHVAGTLAAGGVDRQAQGMAPEASVLSFDWTNDIDELASAADEGVVVSNHSYGYPRGWSRKKHAWYWYGDPNLATREDYRFGKYTGVSSSFDRLAYENRGLSVFVAAGNDRNDDPTRDGHFDGQHYVVASKSWSREPRNADGFDHGGYDTVAGAAVAKNVISVGAIEDIVSPAPNPADVKVTSFSSWGPADDGRVKPDLVANGADLYSPTVRQKLDGSHYLDQYIRLPGTSMASPVASGVAVLLNELARREIGRSLYSDEIKALLIHTAVSPHSGPSYQIGWGSLRADLAGNHLAGEGGSLFRATVAADGVQWQGAWLPDSGIRVTLVWLDPAGQPNGGGLDDRDPALVYNLDLTVTAPTGAVFYPWSLDPSAPDEAATRSGPNTIDNVERVDVYASEAESASSSESTAGNRWTITVTGPREAIGHGFVVAVGGLVGE